MKNRRVCSGCIVLAILMWATAWTQAEEHWPGWRGPDGGGIADESGLKLEWGPEKNLLWKTAIPGKGHSSPIVWGDRIFLTTSIRGEKLEDASPPKHLLNGEEFTHPQWAGADHSWTLKLLCLDRSSGRVLWERTAYQGAVYDYIHQAGSYAAPTPVTDGESVWAYFGAEGLYSYDFEGNLKWKTDLGPIGTVGMGTGTSPVLYKDKLLLVCDQEFDGKDSFALALDKNTGQQLWKVQREIAVTWATPLLVEGREGPQMVVSGASEVVSYDPEDGSELWRTEGVVSNAIPSPVSDGRLVFVSAGSAAKRVMALRLELDEDGPVNQGATPEQVSGARDGEAQAAGSSPSAQEQDAEAEEPPADPRIVWRYDKGAAYVPSPIYYQGLFYLINDRGQITALDAQTGQVIYQERLPDEGRVASSLVAADGKILATTLDGRTYVFKAGRQFEVLASNQVGEPVWASLAI
ncbi:MAG TPA: PQQ-binding-like beta-propeller repeat protein, partial [Acidobacteriota bacterium]|nr:PQQ-binding-like beta-propeller repeat protein [Acidobacteriota bacterium]